MARELSYLLGLSVLDIDDDVLERNWGQSVADKLRQLGDDNFLRAEAEEVMAVQVERTIISLSGSAQLDSSGSLAPQQLPAANAHRLCDSFVSTPIWRLTGPILSISMQCPTSPRAL